MWIPQITTILWFHAHCFFSPCGKCSRNWEDEGVTALALPGRKHCPLPDTIFWGEERQRQSRSGTSPLISPRLAIHCGCEKRPVRHCDIPLNNHFSPMKAHYPPPTIRNLFYTCEICLACRMFCGRWDLWMGSVFPHYVTGLFISLMANDPDSCEGFSPRPDWSTHPLTHV